MVERRSPRKRISFGFPSGELRINPLADEDCEVARPVDDAVATPVLTAGWAPALLRHRVATDPDTPRSSVAASPYPLEASLAFPAGLTFDELLGDLGAPAGDLVVPNCFTWSAATRDFSFHYREAGASPRAACAFRVAAPPGDQVLTAVAQCRERWGINWSSVVIVSRGGCPRLVYLPGEGTYDPAGSSEDDVPESLGEDCAAALLLVAAGLLRALSLGATLAQLEAAFAVALPVFVEAHGRRHLAAFVFEQIRAVVQLRDARYPEFLKAAAARGDLDLGDPGRRHTRAYLASYDRCSPEPPVEYLDLVSIGGCHVLEGAPALPETAPELHRAVETRAYGRVARAIADGDIDVACDAGDTALHVVARLLSTEAVLDHEPVWFDYAALCLELLHRGAALHKNDAGDTPASALPTRRALRHLLYGTASALDPLELRNASKHFFKATTLWLRFSTAFQTMP